MFCKNTITKFCFVLALLCGGFASDLRCMDPAVDPVVDDINIPLDELLEDFIRQQRRQQRRQPRVYPGGYQPVEPFRAPEFRCNQIDAAHLGITAVHRGGIYYLHDLFIKKHKTFILKQMVRDHESFLEALNEVAEYNDEGTRQDLRKYLEEKHTFVGFNISKEELGNVVMLALLSSGEAAAARGLHVLAGETNPFRGGTTCSDAIRGFGEAFIELPE